MPRTAVADTVAELCADQWGFVTTSQARANGVTPQQMKRLTDKGVLDRLHYGIYRMARLPHDPHQTQRLAWIALDPDTPAWKRLDEEVPTGVISHRSAADLHGLGDIDADITEITATRRIRLTLPDLRIHTASLTHSEWVNVDGVPTTTALRTIGDLASSHLDGGHLATVVRDALEKGLTTAPATAATLSPHAFDYGHPLNDGAGFLSNLIAEAGISENVSDLANIYQVAQAPAGSLADLVSGHGSPHNAGVAAYFRDVYAPQTAELNKKMREALFGGPQMAATRSALQQALAPNADLLRSVQNALASTLEPPSTNLAQALNRIAAQTNSASESMTATRKAPEAPSADQPDSRPQSHEGAK